MTFFTPKNLGAIDCDRLDAADICRKTRKERVRRVKKKVIISKFAMYQVMVLHREKDRRPISRGENWFREYRALVRCNNHPRWWCHKKYPMHHSDVPDSIHETWTELTRPELTGVSQTDSVSACPDEGLLPKVLGKVSLNLGGILLLRKH